MTSAQKWLTWLTSGAIAIGLAGAPAALAQPDHPAPAEKQKDGVKQEQPKKDENKQDAKQAEPAKVGSHAPSFTLTDTDGKTHSLSDYAGKIVVLQWFNSTCPYVVKHYGDTKTFNNLYTNYKEKDVVVLAVNSNAPGKQGSGKDQNAKVKKDWAIEYPILLDESGEVGKAYGSKNTPAMAVIGKDGVLAYFGAIDDNNGSEKPGKTNYVTKAIDELLAGKPVSTPETRPYGCSIKYAK